MSYLPKELFSMQALMQPKVLLILSIGGFLVGFGVLLCGRLYFWTCYFWSEQSSIGFSFMQSSVSLSEAFFMNHLITSLYTLSMRLFIFFLIGILFGITMFKSEARILFRIYEMFQFNSFHVWYHWVCFSFRGSNDSNNQTL